MNEHKVLIKTNGIVNQNTYTKSKKQDFLYYYVYYNSTSVDELFEIYTNQEHYGENRVISKVNTLKEAVLIAESINDAVRLLAGYHDDSFVLNNKFPIKINK